MNQPSLCQQLIAAGCRVVTTSQRRNLYVLNTPQSHPIVVRSGMPYNFIISGINSRRLWLKISYADMV